MRARPEMPWIAAAIAITLALTSCKSPSAVEDDAPDPSDEPPTAQEPEPEEEQPETQPAPDAQDDSKQGAAATPDAPRPETAEQAIKHPDFRVEATFEGEPAALDTSSHEQAGAFKTRLSEELPKGPNFAGAWRIIPIGCGTSCLNLFLTSVTDGTVHSVLPSCGAFEASLNSRLLVINPPTEDAYMPKSCTPRYYVLRDGELVELPAEDPRLPAP